MPRMINHKAVANDIVAACNKHALDHDESVKCLIYTATKLLAKKYAVPEHEAADMLSKAAVNFRDLIVKIDRNFSNRG